MRYINRVINILTYFYLHYECIQSPERTILSHINCFIEGEVQKTGSKNVFFKKVKQAGFGEFYWVYSGFFERALLDAVK